MKTQSTALFVYASILLVGGLIGFITKGSLPSLIAGSISSCLIAMTACSLNNSSRLAVWLSRALVGSLAAFFAIRLWSTGAFMPSGLMVVVSSIILALLMSNATAKKQPQT